MKSKLPEFLYAKQFTGHAFDKEEEWLKDAVIEYHSANSQDDSYLTLITVYGDLKVFKGAWICRTSGEYFVLHSTAIDCLTNVKHSDLIPDSPEQLQRISLPENLWELYNTLKSYTNTDSGTFEFNAEGEITKATVHFKKQNNG